MSDETKTDIKSAIVGGVGTASGITLSQFSTICGIVAFLVTILALIPLAISRWRGLLYDYSEYRDKAGRVGFFPLNLIRWLFSPTKRPQIGD